MLMLQAHVVAQANSGAAVVELPETIRSAGAEHWYRSQLPFNATQLVHELCCALDSMQMQHQEGIPEAQGLVRIDIALPEQKVGKLFSILPQQMFQYEVSSNVHQPHTDVHV